MFNLPALRIGRVFGIPIEINPTWLIIFALVSFSLATGYFPQITEAKGAPLWLLAVVSVVSALLFFASLILHELSHSLVARAGGVPVNRITLFLLGGVSQMEDEPHSAGKEFVMAFAGPAMSFLIAAVSYVLYFALSRPSVAAPWWLWAPLGYLAFVNLLLGIFNLLPGFPLDGGRVLRSILWGITHDIVKATRWAARAGQFLGWSMVVLFVADFFTGGRLSGTGQPLAFIWLGLIGWFVAAMASSAYRQVVIKAQLSRFTVANAMTPSPQVIPGDITLEDAAHQYFLGGRHSRYPVMMNGEVVGIITLPMLKSLPRQDWAFRRVIDVTDRDLASLVVDASTHVDDTLARLVPDRPGALLVISEGRMVGIITRADVIDLLQRAEAIQRA